MTNEQIGLEFYMKCSLKELSGFTRNMDRKELEIKFKEAIIMLRDYKVPLRKSIP